MTVLTQELVVQATPVETCNATEMFAGATTSDRFLWIDPESGTEMVGLGVAREFDYEGPNRFANAADDLAYLAQQVLVQSPVQPVLMAGFSFAETSGDKRDPSWHGFPAGRLVLPRITYLSNARGRWMISALPASQAEQHDQVVQATRDAAKAVGSLPKLAADALEGVSVDQEYVALVAKARDVVSFDEGMDKIVAARRAVVDTEVNVPALLAALRSKHLQCATFAVGNGDRVFLGATPERLVRVHNGQIHADALAGTIRRGKSDKEGAALGKQLAQDPKELNEHRHVVDAIHTGLRSAGVEHTVVAQTEVVRLASLQHLRTAISGDVPADINILDLAGALHPTPAVAGVPAAEAVDWLDRNETFDRGWYTGPLGLVRFDGSGEFRVALRSALVEPGRIHLFAGAGIVPRSDPERELAETTVKARAILDSLLPTDL